MPVYYDAVGWFPRPPDQQARWRRELELWLRQAVARREFSHRQARASWGDASSQQQLWNFLSMGNSLHSKGWVASLHTEHTLQPSPNSSEEESRVIERWQAVRCLPEDESGLRQWGYDVGSGTEARVHLGYNRQYNRTLRQRLMRGYMPRYAHRDAVEAMDQQGRELLWRSVAELVVSAAGGCNELGAAGAAAGLGTIPGGHRHGSTMGARPE